MDSPTPLGGTRGWKRIATVQRYPPPAVFPSPRATSGWLRGHIHCLYNFLRAVSQGAQPEPSLTRGIEIQLMMDCAELSAETGTWQKIRSDA